MALYSYKKVYFSPKKKTVEYVSYVSLTIGVLLLFWSFYPILAFEIYARLFIQNNILSPIPKNQMASSIQNATSVLGSSTVFSNNLRDFTNASLWFPTKPQESVKRTVSITDYRVSIPKINIKDANVKVGGEDLSKNLIQYLADSQPGEFGNIVIFGHSTLPQLYNPKDYKTILTYLPSLEKGDKILATVGDTTYTYEVYDMFVVKPEQISVLEQRKDGAYLTLITCVPPGTYWNRLVVRAKLTNLPVDQM